MSEMQLVNSTDPYILALEGYMLCVYKNEGQNPDMQGYAVRISNFIVNLCLAILIRYSNEDVIESVSVLLLQIYTLLVSAFISLIRKKLSVADAHFAITSTVSPLAIYLLYASVRKILRKRSYLYRRLGHHSNETYVALSLLVLLMWIIMDLLIYFADVFTNKCPRITLVSWFMYRFMAAYTSFIFASVFIVILICMWIMYLLRHFRDIRDEYRRHKMKAQPWKHFRWVQWFPLTFKSFMIAQWDVITKGHPWMLTFSVVITYVVWGSSLMLYIPDLSKFYYDLVTGLEEDNDLPTLPYQAPDGYDPLGFGQLLAATVAFPPMWQVLNLIWTRRNDIVAWIKSYPISLWNGIVFILTGHRNPWKKVLERRAENGEAGTFYDSVPLTGPGEERKVGQRTDSTFSNDEKIELETSEPTLWRSTTSFDYPTTYSTSTLYDPYNPARS
ncbi:hypothetical protein GYMLUDRAFT_41418 [Collybiopsis luxurians FD-317 M1]|uniref:Unplaced genomic scaffold GYMLUscaffold_17, whole genome shotgun sequence n=1 Tax=Collybiopsis luxurians FD-317 M1 TaxID=944289 RepID=A0A0D0BGR3_9AGAR|nr:hypothetical protein GYMLUDRAFT_41418 [Collybiopsis luxurians FD-317 M1]